jgi:hypothetical protein
MMWCVAAVPPKPVLDVLAGQNLDVLITTVWRRADRSPRASSEVPAARGRRLGRQCSPHSTPHHPSTVVGSSIDEWLDKPDRSGPYGDRGNRDPRVRRTDHQARPRSTRWSTTATNSAAPCAYRGARPSRLVGLALRYAMRRTAPIVVVIVLSAYPTRARLNAVGLDTRRPCDCSMP